MYRICIAGRPNVGKSTLFNRLYGRRMAITDSMPGVTRDALALECEVEDIPVLLVDTGGIGEGEAELTSQVIARSRREMERADVVLLLVEVDGLTGEDHELLDELRRAGKPAILVVNKVDNEKRSQLVNEFYRYGIDPVIAISAAHGLGIDELTETIVGYIKRDGAYVERGDADQDEGSEQEIDPLSLPVRLAIVGQPNTGKSSLLNRLVDDDRAIVSDIAGTTRDVVEARFSFRGREFHVIDTAGIRRRSRVREDVEFYSVQRAYDAIESAELVVLVIDAVKGLSDQDKKIAARIAARGKGTVVALNKWDLLEDRKNQFTALTDRINFLFPVFQHIPLVSISALTGEGIDSLLSRLLHVRTQIHRRVGTGTLNQALTRWTSETPPPGGKRPIKVRYMTQVTTNPVRFLMFVNRKKGFPEFYLRYVQNRVRKELGFPSIPFFIDVRE